MALFLVFISVVSLAAVSHAAAQAAGTITINQDGSVSGGSDAISHSGNVYSLTRSLSNVSIVVLCNNIVLDGSGFTLQGSGGWPTPAAINLTCTGVTVENFVIAYWEVGILGAYSGNTIYNNSVVGCERDVAIYADNYVVSDNYIGQGDYCLRIVGNNITISENTIDSGAFSFWITQSSGITITDNNIIFTNPMFMQTDDGGFQIYHNNFNNIRDNMYLLQANPKASAAAFLPWDNGYPSGGNYWSNYANDYPNATEIDHSGIGNTPYNVSSSLHVQDRYPLISPTDIFKNVKFPPSVSAPPNISFPPATPESTKRPSGNLGAQAVAVGGLAVLLIGLLVAVVLLARKRKSKMKLATV